MAAKKAATARNTKPAAKPAKAKAQPTKKGQKAKPAAKVQKAAPQAKVQVPTGPAGWLQNTTGHSPRVAGITASTGYPQGTNPVKVMPAFAGLTTQQLAYHAMCKQAMGKAQHMPLPKFVAALAKVYSGSGGPRRVLRRSVRAGFLVWQAK